MTRGHNERGLALREGVGAFLREAGVDVRVRRTYGSPATPVVAGQWSITPSTQPHTRSTRSVAAAAAVAADDGHVSSAVVISDARDDSIEDAIVMMSLAQFRAVLARELEADAAADRASAADLAAAFRELGARA